MRIVAYNVEGLHRGRLSGREDVVKLLASHDIIGLSETWRAPSTDAQTLQVEGFSLRVTEPRRKRGRRGRVSGGLAVYVRKSVAANLQARYVFSKIDDVLWVVIERTPGELLAIGFVYNPDQSSAYANAEFFASLEDEMGRIGELFPGIAFLLVGDMNARTGIERDYVVGDEEPREGRDEPVTLPEDYVYSGDVVDRNSQDCVVNQWGRGLLDLCRSCSMNIMNGRVAPDVMGQVTCVPPTGGSSVVDYGIVSTHLLVHVRRFEILLDYVETSHFPISLDLELPSPLPAPSNPTEAVVADGPVKLPRFRAKEEEVGRYQEYLAGMLWVMTIICMFMARVGRLNEAWDCLVRLVQHAARDCRVIQRPFVKYGKPWFDASCAQLKRACQRSGRLLRSVRCLETITRYVGARGKYKRRCRDRRREFNRRQRTKVEELVRAGDTGGFWQVVKRFKKPRQSIDGSITAEKWKKHFGEVFNAGKDMDTEWAKVVADVNSKDELLDADITGTEVLQAIRKLKNGKAPGADGIGSEFFKSVAGLLTGLLAYLYTRTLTTCQYPAAWVYGVVCAIYKGKGNPKQADSYRGIMLLPVVAKILTTILAHRLRQWLEERGIISEAQAGFRKGYSTVDNCFILDTLRAQALSRRGKKLYVCFVDMRRAFDSVLRPLLFHKLYQLGIRGPFLGLLQSMYAKCKFSVRINESSGTDPVDSTTGVMQGCILSPALFSIFINDIVDFLASDPLDHHAPTLRGTIIECLLYADDLVLISQTPLGLQRQLDRLHRYCEKWGLEVNKAKTEVMVFRRGGKLGAHEQWFYAGEKLRVSSEFRFLGVVFSTKGGWSKHIASATGKASKVVHLLRGFCGKMSSLQMKTLLGVFYTMVKPVVTYGAEVWGYAPSKQLNKPLAKFCKIILGLPMGAPGCGVLLETAAIPTEVDCRLQVLRYWLRLLRMAPDRWAKMAYETQRDLARAGKGGWGLGVRNVLSDIGLEALWESGGPRNHASFLRDARQRLIQKCTGELRAEAETLSSLAFYCDNRDWGNATSPYELLKHRGERRNLALARLELAHVFRTPIYERAGDGEIRQCALCDYAIEAGVWVHLCVECPQLVDIRASAGPMGTVRDYRDRVFRIESARDCRTISAYIQRVMRHIDRRETH